MALGYTHSLSSCNFAVACPSFFYGFHREAVHVSEFNFEALISPLCIWVRKTSYTTRSGRKAVSFAIFAIIKLVSFSFYKCLWYFYKISFSLLKHWDNILFLFPNVRINKWVILSKHMYWMYKTDPILFYTQIGNSFMPSPVLFFFLIIMFPYFYNWRKISHNLGGRSKLPWGLYWPFGKCHPKLGQVTEGICGEGQEKWSFSKIMFKIRRRSLLNYFMVDASLSH